MNQTATSVLMDFKESPYETILQALKEVGDEAAPPLVKKELGYDYYLQEYRTVGLHASRATGAIDWFEKRFITDPEGILILPTSNERANLIERFIDHLSSDVVGRIYTADSIRQLIPQNFSLNHQPRRTYIENPHRVFEVIRKAKFYSWLAGVVDPETHRVFTLTCGFAK